MTVVVTDTVDALISQVWASQICAYILKLFLYIYIYIYTHVNIYSHLSRQVSKSKIISPWVSTGTTALYLPPLKPQTLRNEESDLCNNPLIWPDCSPAQDAYKPPVTFPQYSLCMEVDQHRQLAIDDPLCEVLLVLNVEGDFSAWRVRKTAGQGAWSGEEGDPRTGGLHGGGETRQRCPGGGRWEATDIFHTDCADSA